MFESIIQYKNQSARKGKLTSAFLTETSYHAGLEGFGDLFKSKEQKLKDLREASLEKLETNYEKRHEWMTGIVSDAESEIQNYLAELKELSAKLKGKKFDAAAFAALTFPKLAFRFKVVSDGLYKTGDLVNILEATFKKATDPKTLANPGIIWDYIGSSNLHDRNEAYMAWEDGIMSIGHLPKQDIGAYYTANAGSKVSAGGYTADFVTTLISNGETVANNIKAIIALVPEVEKFYNEAKQMIAKLDDHKEIKGIPEVFTALADNLNWSIHGASAYFPKEAIAIAKFIIKNCYD